MTRFGRNWVLHCAFAVFVVSILLVGRRHEAWFDEAQAWLLARDNSLPDLLGHALRYEGTPGLWHLLLWVAIRCGLAYSGLYLISSALACGGAWLVLYRSPFPAWLRVGVIFSYFFGYQYSVVARSYSLDLLLIPLLAYLYDKRLGRPVLYCLVLGLCVNSNAHSFLIEDVLFADFLWAAVQARRWRESEVMGAMSTFCLLAGAAVLQARPAADLAFLPAVHDNFAPERQILEGVIDSGAVGLLAALVLTVFVLVPIWMLCGWLFAGLLGAVTLFAAVEYANVWHGGMVYLICVLCLWVSWPAAGRMPSWQRNWLMAAVALLLVVQVRETLESWRRELREPYSSGLRAAELLKGSVAVGGMGFKAFSVQPWFARNIFANYYRARRRPPITTGARARSLPSSPTRTAGGKWFGRAGMMRWCCPRLIPVKRRRAMISWRWRWNPVTAWSHWCQAG